MRALLLLEAYRIQPSVRTRGAMFSALLDEPRLTATLPVTSAGPIWPAPDGKTVVMWTNGRLERWDVGRRRMIRRFPFRNFTAAAMSPTGTLAVSSADGVVHFVDLGGAPVARPIQLRVDHDRELSHIQSRRYDRRGGLGPALGRTKPRGTAALRRPRRLGGTLRRSNRCPAGRAIDGSHKSSRRGGVQRERIAAGDGRCRRHPDRARRRHRRGRRSADRRGLRRGVPDRRPGAPAGGSRECGHGPRGLGSRLREEGGVARRTDGGGRCVQPRWVAARGECQQRGDAVRRRHARADAPTRPLQRRAVWGGRRSPRTIACSCPATRDR